jgi:4-hydroxy-4-methyl-2-oxoglutarate aldolase
LNSQLATRLIEIGVATLHEASGRRGLMHEVELLVGDPFAGRAVTVSLPAGDNLGIHLALETAERGSVLCVGSAGRGAYGVLGDLLFESARNRGIAGLVIDDGIRDLKELSGPPGLAARGVRAQGTVKARLRQQVGAIAAIAGQLVRPTDWIVCDRDGICVLPSEDVDQILAAASARTEKEDAIRVKLRSGRTTVDVFDLPPTAEASVG